MTVWPYVEPKESKLLRFRFDNQLETGDLITSVDFEVTDMEGADPAPASILTGSTTISGTDVFKAKGGSNATPLGLNGSRYHIKCYANTQAGRRHLVDAVLPVRIETGN